MDNITHSAIGVVIGHAMRRWAGTAPDRGDLPDLPDLEVAKQTSPALRAGVLVAVFGSNAPDLDVLGRFLQPWAKPDGLAFLLQHRGYSHSLLMAPIEAGLAVAAAWWLTPARLRPWLKVKGLFAIGLVGALLHIGADSWNDYGIHPFSPFWNRWFYGDFIFILEPMLWFGLLPLGIFRNQTVSLRAICAVLWLGMLGAAWFGPVSGVLTSVWLTFWALAWLGVSGALRRKRGAWMASAAAGMLTLALFATGAQVARARLAELLPPGGAQTEIGTSPFPGNPLLWKGIVARAEPDGKYSALQFTLSLAPALFDPPKDFFRSGGPEESVLDARIPGLRRLESFEGTAAELRRLSERYCRVRGVLGFVRFPYWKQSGREIEVGDMRYDRGGRGFSHVDVDEGSTEDCPRYFTPWIPPVSPLIPIK